MNLFLHYLGLPYLLSGIGFTIAVTALGLAGYSGGPLILTGGLALAVAGWRMGRG